MELHARSLWLLSEPLHAVCYFDDRCRRLGKDLGLKGFWMGYFASRTAPMGAVEPAAATAVLGVFAPGMVARALPAAWSVVSPAHVLDERGRRAAHALRAIDPGLKRTAAAVLPPLQTIVDEAPALARPLFAANRTLCDHADPVERLWQLVTTVREFEGRRPSRGARPRRARRLRGAGPGRRLGARSPGHHAGRTAAGARRSGRTRRTGCAPVASWTHGATRPNTAGKNASASRRRPTGWPARPLRHPLPEAETEGLLHTLEPLVRRLLAADVLPFPNPIGLPHLDEPAPRGGTLSETTQPGRWPHHL